MSVTVGRTRAERCLSAGDSTNRAVLTPVLRRPPVHASPQMARALVGFLLLLLLATASAVDRRELARKKKPSKKPNSKKPTQKNTLDITAPDATDHRSNSMYLGWKRKFGKGYTEEEDRSRFELWKQTEARRVQSCFLTCGCGLPHCMRASHESSKLHSSSLMHRPC